MFTPSLSAVSTEPGIVPAFDYTDLKALEAEYEQLSDVEEINFETFANVLINSGFTHTATELREMTSDETTLLRIEVLKLSKLVPHMLLELSLESETSTVETLHFEALDGKYRQVCYDMPNCDQFAFKSWQENHQFFTSNNTDGNWSIYLSESGITDKIEGSPYMKSMRAPRVMEEVCKRMVAMKDDLIDQILEEKGWKATPVEKWSCPSCGREYDALSNDDDFTDVKRGDAGCSSDDCAGNPDCKETDDPKTWWKA